MASPGREPETQDRHILREFMLAEAPFLHATELADTFDMSRQGVYKRLVKLEERGLLKSKKSGNVRNWWITDEGKRYVVEQS